MLYPCRGFPSVSIGFINSYPAGSPPHPPRCLRIKIPRPVVVETCLLVILLPGEAEGDVVVAFGRIIFLDLDPHLPIGGVLDSFVGVALGIGYAVGASQVVGVIVVGVDILIGAPPIAGLLSLVTMRSCPHVDVLGAAEGS